VITGFNTDIEHGGVVYHVQTEDKGLASPLILSLVYVGGAILASKRTPYEDLIADGFNEEVLAQRLQRQHRLICAAVNAGRLDDLKRMGSRLDVTAELPPLPATPPAGLPLTAKPKTEMSPPVETAVEYSVAQPPTEQLPPEIDEPTTKRRSRAKDKNEAYTVYDQRGKSPLGDVARVEKGLVLTILDEREFAAGETVTFSVLVQNKSGQNQKPVEGVTLSVKILGTNFRPQLYSVKTARDGVAVVSAKLPRFTSGRAAILIRAVAEGHSTEMRKVIHPAKR
jgi:hypothetical protein